MKLKCPDCGKDDAITAETFGAQWDEVCEKWIPSEEVTGPYICQHCSYESKYVDAFKVENH